MVALQCNYSEAFPTPIWTKSRFISFHPKGNGFKSCSSRHVGPSLAVVCGA